VKLYAIIPYIRGPERRDRQYLDSGKLNIGEAIGWLVDELPEEAREMLYTDPDGNPLPAGTSGITRTRIEIDWSKVPGDPAHNGEHAPEPGAHP
jgi:hypothetical protein